jgi:hypothetical protein
MTTVGHCHSERSEESFAKRTPPWRKILRFTQDDSKALRDNTGLRMTVSRSAGQEHGLGQASGTGRIGFLNEETTAPRPSSLCIQLAD